MRGYDAPAVVGGQDDAYETERQLASMLSDEVQVAWLPHVRVNFTLGSKRPSSLSDIVARKDDRQAPDQVGSVTLDNPSYKV